MTDVLGWLGNPVFYIPVPGWFLMIIYIISTLLLLVVAEMRRWSGWLKWIVLILVMPQTIAVVLVDAFGKLIMLPARERDYREMFKIFGLTKHDLTQWARYVKQPSVDRVLDELASKDDQKAYERARQLAKRCGFNVEANLEMHRQLRRYRQRAT